MNVLRGVCVGWAFAMTAPSMAFAAELSALGTNLDAVEDYSPQMPFVNLFKASRAWYGQADGVFDTAESHLLDLDANDEVKSLRPKAGTSGTARFTRVCTLLMSMGPVSGGALAGQLPYPAGQYVVRYDGQGTLSYSLAARHNTALSAAGRDVLDVTPAEPGIQICITQLPNAANPIRNIRVYAPGTEAAGEAGQRFSTAFVQRLKPYSVLRFMDWMRTNNSTQQQAADRPLPTQARFSTERGVPADIIAELATQTGSVPWVNIPHQASDDWVRSFATALLNGLPAGRRVMLEYSNEVWNGIFSQASHIEAEGVAKFANQSGSNFDKRLSRYGERAAEVCTVFRQVAVSKGESPERIHCVMGGQAANTYIAETALTCPMSRLAPCRSAGFKALAIAPYVGDHIGLSQNQATVEGWTRQSDGGLTALFNELNQGGSAGITEEGALPAVQRRMTAHASVAKAQGVTLVAYEGGQHLVGVGTPQNSTPINTLMDAANRDARMGTLYQKLLSDWTSAGGGLFVHFSDIGAYSRFGRWGSLELPDQTSSPKHDALTQAGRSVQQRIFNCAAAVAEKALPEFFNLPATRSGNENGMDFKTYGSSHTFAITQDSRRIIAFGPVTGGQAVTFGTVAELGASVGCQ